MADCITMWKDAGTGKNYSDGKYYLFNKSMYSDSAFKPH